MTWNFLTASDPFGHCFKLPALGLPDPEGEWCVIEGAVTTKDPAKVAYDSAAFSKPCMRFPTHGTYTMPVEHEGATWYLPMVDFNNPPRMGGKENKEEYFTVRVQRLPAHQQKGSDRGPPARPTSASSASTVASEPSSSRKQSDEADDVTSSLGKVSLSPSSPSMSQASSTAASSPSASSSRTKVSQSAEDEYQHDSDECIEFLDFNDGGLSLADMLEFGRKHNQEMLSKIKPEEREGALRLFQNMRGHFPMEPNLFVNGAWKGRIRWTRYVTTLPKGDAPPAWAIRVDRRLRNPSPYWAVIVEEQTFYHLTCLSPEDKRRTWALLTDPNKNGIPCTVEEPDVITVKLHSGESPWFRLTRPVLRRDEPASLMLRPIPLDYACQPKAASAEASYILNHYQVLVEQNGRRFVALEPLAELTDLLTERVLVMLAECASGQDGAGDIVYSGHPPMKGGEKMSQNLYRVGIRLRDGGARFPITTTSLGRSVAAPGPGEFLAKWGTLEKLSSSSPKFSVIKEVPLAIPVPPGPQDVILRVADAPRGKFRKIEYVLRPGGSTKAIKDDEWKPFAVGKKDEWVLSYLCNLARLSFGRLKLRRPPLGTGSFTD